MVELFTNNLPQLYKAKSTGKIDFLKNSCSRG